jgi:hypothetical protein
MAPNRNPNEDDAEHKRFDDNPFVSFRRFADEQVSGLLNFTARAMGVSESQLARRGDTGDRRSAYEDMDEKHAYTRRADGEQADRDGSWRNKKFEEELDELDREMTAWLNGAEHHPRKAVDDAGDHDRQEGRDDTKYRAHGCWHARFGGCRKNREGSNEGHDTDNWENESTSRAGSRWGDLTRRMDTEEGQQRKPKVHSWHWSWSYPPTTSAESHKESAETVPEDIFKWFEDSQRTFFGTSVPFPVLGFGSNYSLAMQLFLSQSDYSPLQLESSLKGSDVMWRNAFEDLLRAETGQPLLAQRELAMTNRTSRLQWMSQFQARTLFNSHMSERGTRPFWVSPASGEPILPTFIDQRLHPSRLFSPVEAQPVEAEPVVDEHDSYEYGHDHEDQHDDPPTPLPDKPSSTFNGFTESDPEDGPETELNAYERLLGPTTNTHSNNPREDTTSRPSVLSTLTTTERTTHPDGTVTTKMVLKKRFADGREESSETIHTTQGHDNHIVPEMPLEAVVQRRPKQQEAPPKQDGEKKSNGWFWS